MAHFAEIDADNGKVRRVIVIANDDCGGGDFPASEAAGKQFIAACGIAGEWVQTSYNSNFRGKYAGIGDTYDAENDVFVSPTVEVAE